MSTTDIAHYLVDRSYTQLDSQPRAGVFTEIKTTRRFLGVYHTVKFYEQNNEVYAEFGGLKRSFTTVKQFQHAVRKWEHEDD